MPRKIVEPPKYKFAPWRPPIDSQPHLVKMAAQLAEMPRHEFLTWLLDLPEEQQVAAWRLRFRFDRMWFLTACWPDAFKRGFNRYHVETLTAPKHLWLHRVPRNEYRSVAAPRGIAKTTTSKGDLCHDAVYGLEGFVVVHSAGLREGSEPFVKDVANMLTSSPRLEYLYGPAKAWRDGEYTLVQVGEAPQLPIIARSFRTQVRGQSYRLQRPTKYIIDDGEHPVGVKNPDTRRSDATFLYEDIANCGPKEGGFIIDMRGTMLHADSLLMATTTSPAWKHKTWQALEAWPLRLDLWDQCRVIWSDRTKENHVALAEQFYAENKAEMDRGAVVLDEEAAPLFALYTNIWTNGLASFMKDQQNDILATSDKFFDMERIVFFDMEQDPNGRRFVRSGAENDVVSYVNDMKKVMYLDPIPADQLGDMHVEGPGGSDYAAIAVLGRDKFGTVFVLEVWMTRARSSEQIDAMFRLGETWGVRKAYIEPVAFGTMVQRDFNRLKRERREAGLFFDVTVESFPGNTNANKEERIAALEGPLTNTNWLRLPKNLSIEARNQFRDFPNGSHDDAPDAVAGAYKALGGSPVDQRGAAVKVQ